MPREAARRSVIAAALVLLTVGGLAGCRQNQNWGRYNQVRSSPTPELMTLDRRQVDVDRQIRITSNTRGRMIWSDLGRATLLDRPTRLSPYPVPH